MTIDLNCDLGEGAPHDAELMPLITSANIACGGHAGDVDTIQRTLKLASMHGVAIGAHPSFPDRENFGRAPYRFSIHDLRGEIEAQIFLVSMLAEVEGLTLHHVKPHGALYNQAARDPELATIVASCVSHFDSNAILYGLAGSELINAGLEQSLRVAREIFADRRYQPDGSLVPRSEQNAVITDPAESCEQVLRLIRKGKADTVCLHGDGPHAVTFAHELRRALDKAGIQVKAFQP